MAVHKQHSNRELFEFFQSRLSGLNADTALKYRRTVSELDLFLTGHRLQLSDLSPVMMADFSIELLRKGLAKNTVVYHLNILNGLVKSAAKRGLLETTDAPRVMARQLSETAIPLPPLMMDERFAECLNLLRQGLKGGDGLSGDSLKFTEVGGDGRQPHDKYEDMLLFALLNGVMSLRDVAMLRKGDVTKYNEISRGIADRNVAPRRDFVFALRQSYTTPKQIYKAVSEGLKRSYQQFVDKNSFSDEFDADTLARSIWVACAVKSGATASEAFACVEGNADYVLPDFCRDSFANLEVKAKENKSLWVKTVNAVLTHDMPRWYAMHLRKGVDYNELRKDINESIRPVPELFYPSETIKKRVGNKTVIDEKPFISHTVFFKSYPEKILPMFSQIGDKAWCYRVTRSAGSPYAVISSRDMKRFQAVIGVFTPDIEVHNLGELSPKPGESVVVIKAGYNNRRGEVEDVINTESGSVIFRVKLSTDQGYEWRIDLDERQIERILE